MAVDAERSGTAGDAQISGEQPGESAADAQRAQGGASRTEALEQRDFAQWLPQDLGRLANDYEADLPRAFRFLTRGLGTRETRSNDMLSLVMFQPDYVQRLIEMGRDDARARLPELKTFLSSG